MLPELPYFYGQEAEQFTFYRIPKIFFTSELFSGLSTDAKVLYGLMLDRMQLSIRNGWLDEEGRVFIYYTLENIKADLGCADQKAVKLLAELDQKYRLIERKRQGLGKPMKIYVKNFSRAIRAPCSQTCDFQKSRLVKIIGPELRKSQSNNTEKNKNKKSDIESIYQGGMEPDGTNDSAEDGFDTMSSYERYQRYFERSLSIEALKNDYPYDRETLQEMLELLTDTVCSTKKMIRVGGEEKPAVVVKSRLMKLDSEHIRYVLECFKKNTTNVRNIRQYMLAALYNAPATISSYYSAQVSHDMYGHDP